MRIRQLIISVAILIIVIGAAAFFYSLKEEPEQTPKAARVRYVTTETVAYQYIHTTMEGYGRVSTTMPLDITSEVQGKMEEGSIHLKEGTNFKKGQTLFKIDDTITRYQLQAQKASFLRDVAGILPDMKIDYPNSYPIWNAFFESLDVSKPLPALPKHQSGKEKTFLATRNIFTNYYQIKSSETNLYKHYYKAPFEGAISEVYLQIGSFVNPGTRIARIHKTESLELNVALPPENIQWLQVGKKVSVSTEDGGKQWQGEISRIADVVNPNTQSLSIYIHIIPDKEHTVYEGMYLKAIIRGIDIPNAMRIPRNALIDQRLVYIVKDSVLQLYPVKIHKISEENAIVSGIPEGEKVVSEPLINAYEGMQVKILNDNLKRP
ncbi:efflux RND transporter periplasmic adaptor subunit [Algivirga pacifica]|uniref:CzcB/NccB family metal efflux transporter periplasmic adaptor subunit n=1 Tax=Algivirga pacifica TaxID=1162670 RepID=A0ABP9D9E8_9BACT